MINDKMINSVIKNKEINEILFKYEDKFYILNKDNLEKLKKFPNKDKGKFYDLKKDLKI